MNIFLHLCTPRRNYARKLEGGVKYPTPKLQTAERNPNVVLCKNSQSLSHLSRSEKIILIQKCATYSPPMSHPWYTDTSAYSPTLAVITEVDLPWPDSFFFSAILPTPPHSSAEWDDKGQMPFLCPTLSYLSGRHLFSEWAWECSVNPPWVSDTSRLSTSPSSINC